MPSVDAGFCDPCSARNLKTYYPTRFAAALGVALFSLTMTQGAPSQSPHYISASAESRPEPKGPSAPPRPKLDATGFEREFDVVSIRRSDSDQAAGLYLRPDGYHAKAIPLGRTILRAFFPKTDASLVTTGGVSRDWILNAPSWIWNEKFDVIGTIPGESRTLWDQTRWGQDLAIQGADLMSILQPMLLKALEDRCHLQWHYVPSVIQGFALVVANERAVMKYLKATPASEKIAPDTVPLQDGGRLRPVITNDTADIYYYNTSMASLAAELPHGFPVPIIDRTNLQGKYDFKLSGANMMDEGTVGSNWNLKDLGLKLVPIKVPIQKVYIASIDRPDED